MEKNDGVEEKVFYLTIRWVNSPKVQGRAFYITKGHYHKNAYQYTYEIGLQEFLIVHFLNRHLDSLTRDVPPSEYIDNLTLLFEAFAITRNRR